MQGVQGRRYLKAPIVTTGIPGTTDGIGGTADRADESPTSFLHGLPSMESPMSSQRTAAEFHELRVLGTDQLTIARDPAGSLGSASAADSELRRSLRNHNSEDRKVGHPCSPDTRFLCC